MDVVYSNTLPHIFDHLLNITNFEQLNTNIQSNQYHGNT